MGFNTVHRDAECYIKGYNQTNNTYFKYSEVSPQELLRKSLGFVNIEGANLTIKINGRINVAINDRVVLAGNQVHKVISVQSLHSHRQLIKRCDIERIQGETILSLE